MEIVTIAYYLTDIVMRSLTIRKLKQINNVIDLDLSGVQLHSREQTNI